MSRYQLSEQYPQPIDAVWRALTDPALVPRWTVKGKGARPVGFVPEVGRRFQFIAKPMPGWSGVVDCEVLEIQPPSLLRYSWQGGPEDDVTVVTCRLEPKEGGTRLSFEHTGFTGLGGWLMSLLLSWVRRKMLHEGLRSVLREMEVGGASENGRPHVSPA